MVIKSVKQAEKFVNQQKRLGNDVRWDNYDIVFWRESEKGVTSKDGAFRNGKWGFENRFAVNESGEWNIDGRNVRRGKRPRR
jgi:hypothetical protein